MRIFRCDHCGNALFFENSTCLQCRSPLAFLPDRMDLCSIEPAADAPPGLWQRKVALRRPRPGATRWRLCANHSEHQACNWAVPEHDANPYCVSCRLTRVLPNLESPENKQRWYSIEVAKRRLIFSLARLGLVAMDPPPDSTERLVFEFLEDQPGKPVLTGHANGLITLNVAEADDDERVRRRIQLHEPYRTLLGHLRHESGHYYWERLIDEPGRHEDFRRVFGDERKDYGQALSEHYARGGTTPGWQDAFVSAYATAHPWEDWAETWAHYLHMIDLLETAASYGTRLAVPGSDEPVEEVADPFEAGPGDFDELVAQWVPLTLLVNSLNRALGQDDAYPFALRQGALDKLRYIHDLIHQHRASLPPARLAQPETGDVHDASATA